MRTHFWIYGSFRWMGPILGPVLGVQDNVGECEARLGGLRCKGVWGPY